MSHSFGGLRRLFLLLRWPFLLVAAVMEAGLDTLVEIVEPSARHHGNSSHSKLLELVSWLVVY